MLDSVVGYVEELVELHHIFRIYFSFVNFFESKQCQIVIFINQAIVLFKKFVGQFGVVFSWCLYKLIACDVKFIETTTPTKNQFGMNISILVSKHQTSKH